MSFGVDDYPKSWTGVNDPYGFALRQCASFANWRCMNDFKIGAEHNPTGRIDGGTFADFMKTKGYTVDGIPRAHDIVSLPKGVDNAGSYGHVAIVLAVHLDGTILVEDYNWLDDCRYRQHTIKVAGCRFAHIQQQPAPAPAPSGENDMANIDGGYFAEKELQIGVQIARDGNLWVKHWSPTSGGWKNVHVASGLNATGQGVRLFFTPGQAHIMAEGNDGLMRHYYSVDAVNWSPQTLP
jgi:surface antigen